MIVQCLRCGLWKLGLVSSLAMGGANTAFLGDCALAQITPDTTLGAESSVVTPNVNIEGLPSDRIEGGAIRGANLFHSFGEFNIGEGHGAYFTNPAGIENILSRVTGANPSNILGRLGVLGNANLFLINPNGIIFGPNASLDVGGSFVASTASSLNFADGTQFSATADPTTPLLTINVPIGLQFEGNAGRIQVQGNGKGLRSIDDPIIAPSVSLRVQPNQTLALVGGYVALEGGTLKTAGGRIELGSVVGSGLVSLTPIDKGWALGYEGVPTFGDIHLSGMAAVDASGEGGGDIQVRGRQVTLTNGSQIEASTLGAEPGGTLIVSASESVEAIGTTMTTDNKLFSSGLLNLVSRGATGAGGNLIIETGRLIVRDGAQIVASTFGSGSAGTLAVIASESVELISTSEFYSGYVSALATTVQAGATGAGGNLTIKTGRLIVRDGAAVSTATLGDGAGGTLEVSASESVELIDTSADGRPSRLTTRSRDTGDAGNLTIETGQLTVRNGAEIRVNSEGRGKAGNLKATARHIRLDDGDITATTASGNGGGITLRSEDLLLLRRNSQISTTAGLAGTGGNGGNITIDTPFIVAVPKENSDITANAFSGGGGRVTIEANGIFGIAPLSRQELERLRPEDLDPLQLPTNDITAISQTNPSLSGTVEINTPDVDPSQGLVELPAVPIDTEVVQACQPGGSQAQSEFIITGRGGLPRNPGDVLSTDALQVDLITLDPEVTQPSNPAVSTNPTSPAPARIVEAQGWVKDANGNVVLIANAPTLTPHSSWQKTANCRAFNQHQGH